MTEPNRAVDLNADLGEGFPNDVAILDRVTSASLACGGHAGDPDSILRTLRAARERGVVIGAHPGYPDRATFGRREQTIATEQVTRLVLDQFARLEALARQEGVRLRYIKPHGALYNQAQREEQAARGVIAALRALHVPLVGQPGSLLARLAKEAGLVFVDEGFPDRRYRPDGSLAPRTEPDAILHESEAIESQAVRLAEQGIATLCIHGDDPRAVANADHVRSALLREGFALRSFA